MSRYATKRSFGGRPATVGAIVILAAPKHDDPSKTCLRAGIIIAISSSQDRPYIEDVKTGAVDWDAPAWFFVECIDGLPTREAMLAQIEAMPVGSWTWPL